MGRLLFAEPGGLHEHVDCISHALECLSPDLPLAWLEYAAMGAWPHTEKIRGLSKNGAGPGRSAGPSQGGEAW